MSNLRPIRSLLKRIHNDERGAVSIETVLIVAAVAIPILIFIVNFVMPRLKKSFNSNMSDLDLDGRGMANDQIN
ncbi:MAG: hypothetical protein HUJ26_12410 [Planctomycetaceae bacterium]|nr:hypothetical protein [Planctomycetaceae bacterium]